jgi:hypothetical protein
MTFYKQVAVDITPEQMRKAVKMQPIQLSKEQVAGSGSKMFVHPENYKKVMSAKMKGTGCRIQISPDAMKYDMEQMQGGSIWSWIKDKAYPWLKQNVLPVLADAAVPAAAAFLGPTGATAARQIVKNVAGFGVKPAKGSAQMKEKMAKLRAMKAMKGNGFRLN